MCGPSADLNKEWKARLRQIFEGMTSDLAAIDEHCAPGFAAHLPAQPMPVDKSGFRGFCEALYDAFPDMTHTVEEILMEGDRAAILMTVRGTHQGWLMGIEPSHQPVVFTDLLMVRLSRDGQLAELWAQFDFMAVMVQVGARPMKA